MTRPVTVDQARDIAEMVTLQPQWQLDYQQLSGGHYRGQIVNAWLPGLHLTQETSNKASRQQGSLYQHDIGMALVESSVGPCRFHGQIAGPDSVMVGPAGELDLLTPDDCCLLATLVPRASFMSVLWQLDPHKADRVFTAPVALTLAPGKADHLRQLIRSVLDILLGGQGARIHPAALNQMQDAVMLAWHEALAPHCTPGTRLGSPGPGNRRLLVKSACQYVRDCLPQAPTLLALCKEVGASPRKLEYCFQEVLGIPPARYLRLMRLNGAHRALMQVACDGGRTTVQEVASQWGFWHMGAFATDYKRLYGRPPSQTLGS